MKTVNKILLTAFIILILAVLSLVTLVRFGLSGEVIHGTGEIMEVKQGLYESFHKLDLRNNMKVTVSQDTAQQVTIKAHENIARLVDTEVADGTLLVSLPESVSEKDKPTVHIVVNHLEHIKASLGIVLESEGPIQGATLRKEIQAGVKSTLDLDYHELDLRMRAGAHSTLNGQVNHFIINSTAGSFLDASGLRANVCKINTRTGTVNNIYVTDTLSGVVSQGAIVTYRANPDISALEIRGGGQLNQHSDQEATYGD